ncbi:MAG TPA: heavy metal-associated domain-containing protein [Methylocella sp.]|nr:heavy metal-associated domain-containing protein [Methylocella sp.]
MSSQAAAPKSAQSLIFHVKGMHCESCVARVEKAISETKGIASVKVDLAGKRATVTFSGRPDVAAVIAAIGEAGYESSVENSPA